MGEGREALTSSGLSAGAGDPRELTVAVLGAGGTIAPAIVRDLAESDEVASLRLLDLDADRAQQVAAEHGGGKAQASAVDARDPGALARALGGSDVLVNSASYRVNLEAMEACLEATCHYLDLGGLYWMTERQLGLHDRFAAAGLLALLGMGSSPGKTNVMAVRAVEELGLRPHALHVLAAGRDPGASGDFAVPYALETLLDEVTMAPVVVRDGRATEIEPLTPGGVVDYPEPVGEAETIHTIHSELRTLPESFGCRECSFRLSLEPSVLARLRELAAAPEEEVRAASASAGRASSQTVSVHLVEAEAGERSVRVAAVTRPMPEWGLGGGVVSTAAPAAAAVRLMARGAIDSAGALPPERCVAPADLFPELERRACTFTVEAGVAA